MKKFRSRFTAIISAAILVGAFSFTSSVNAKDLSAEVTQEKVVKEEKIPNFNRKEVLEKLKFSKKITQTQINSLNDAMLYELSKDPGEIVSITQTENIINTQTNTNDFSIMSMPAKDFKLTVVAQRISEKAGDNFKFTATGDWIASPTWEFQDTISLAWSDSFTLYSDYSYMYGFIGTQQTALPGTRNNVSAEKGVGHAVDLRAGVNDDKAVLVAKVYKNASSGTANVVAEYGHVELTASVTSLNFGLDGDSPSVSFQVDWNSRINEAIPAYAGFSY